MYLFLRTVEIPNLALQRVEELIQSIQSSLLLNTSDQINLLRENTLFGNLGIILKWQSGPYHNLLWMPAQYNKEDEIHFLGPT